MILEFFHERILQIYWCRIENRVKVLNIEVKFRTRGSAWDHGFADGRDDFKTAFARERVNLARGEHAHGEAFLRIFGEPFGFAGFDESGLQ